MKPQRPILTLKKKAATQPPRSTTPTPPGKKSHCVEQLKKTTAQLMEKFPAVFEEARSKPLKIGILEEVMASGPRMSKKHARLSLAYYTRHLSYQRALLVATHRYDLDGQSCGEVTEAQKETAKRHIKRVHEHWKKRKQQKKKQRPVKQTDAKPPQHSVQDPAIEQGSTSTMNPK